MNWHTFRLRGIVAALGLALICGLSGSVRAMDAQDANAILDKAIKALGGEEQLTKLQTSSWKSKGTISFNGMEAEITSLAVVQGLDHFRQEVEGSFGGNAFKAVTAVTGDKGMRDFGGQHSDLDKDAVTNEKRTTYLAVIPMTILPLKGKDFKVEVIADDTVGGKPAAGINVTGPDKKDFKLYFDKESGLPVKMLAKVMDFMGNEFTQETTYSDYKDISEIAGPDDKKGAGDTKTADTKKEATGVKKATRLESKRDGEKFLTQQITEFKILDKVDPKTFSE